MAAASSNSNWDQGCFMQNGTQQHPGKKDLPLPLSAPAATLPSADPEGHTAASSPHPA